MTECVLRYCMFEKMPVPRAVFRGSEMTGCTFSGCDLSKTDFSDCPMEDTGFSNCDLREADFRGSRGYDVDLKTCNAKGARFSYPEAVRLLDGFGIRIG